VLSGGSSPTGTITFALYSASDTTCSTALETVTTSVNGNGSYDSPTITPANAGSYQWVAGYGGDADNASATNACNETAEQVTVAGTPGPAPESTPPAVIVKAACIATPPVLRGVVRRVRNHLSASVTAPGAKSVTFYLDGRKLKTVAQPKNSRFSLTINTKRLSYGAHRVRTTVTMSDSNCANGALAARFIHAKAAAIRPTFAG
jgi:hypothetical protein